MPCYKPLPAAKVPLAGGTIKVVVYERSHQFSPETNVETFQVPCGQCIGCKLERSRQWAIRMMHEQQIYEEEGRPSCFITLTYETCPVDGSLIKHHFQDFMKKLRRNKTERISYYHCGEYGDEYGRPHYHAAIFGTDFNDKELWKYVNGNPLYTSETLAKIWGRGFASVTDLTFESAAYIARYCLKKQTGKNADYHKPHPITGIPYDVQPEYATMSLKPAIGQKFYEKYGDDIYPHNEVVINGHLATPPRYYSKLYEIDQPSLHAGIKRDTVQQMQNHSHDNTPWRLHQREQVKKAQISMLKRS